MSWLMCAIIFLHCIVITYSEIVDIRFTPSPNSTSSSEGAVELKYNGNWLNVCYRGQGTEPYTWSKREAIVACRQLGYKGGWPILIDMPLTLSQYLHNVDCNGDESTLEHCQYAATASCTDPQFAGTQCYDSFDVQLVSGHSPNIGRVEVNYDDTWSEVCYESKEGDTRSWSFSNVQVMCRELGFPGAMFARRGGDETDIQHSKIYGYKCTGDARETSLADCYPERPMSTAQSSASCGIGNNAIAVCAVPGYIGCFEVKDIINETLPTQHLPNMSINMCRTFCKNNNYTYAGLMGGNACQCKNHLTQVHVSDRLCGNVCAGNSDQVCGGDTTLSLYHVTKGSCEDPFNETTLYYFGDIIDDFKCGPGTEPVSSNPLQCVMDETSRDMRWNDTFPQCKSIEDKTSPTRQDKTSEAWKIIGLAVSVIFLIVVVGGLLLCFVCVYKYKWRPCGYRAVNTTEQGTQSSIPYRLNSFSSFKNSFSFSKRIAKSKVDGPHETSEFNQTPGSAVDTTDTGIIYINVNRSGASRSSTQNTDVNTGINAESLAEETHETNSVFPNQKMYVQANGEFLNKDEKPLTLVKMELEI